MSRQRKLFHLLIYPILILAMLGCTDPLGTGDNSRSPDELMRDIDPDRLTPESRDWLAWFMDSYSHGLRRNHEEYIIPFLQDSAAFIDTYKDDSGNATMFESLAAFSEALAGVEVGVDLEDYYQPVAEYAWNAYDMFSSLATAVRNEDEAAFEKAAQYARACDEGWEYVEFFLGLGE